MKAIYLISEAFLKDYTTVALNVEPQLIKSAILNAQNMYIQEYLGSPLYNKILSLVQSNDISTPTYAAYKTLLDDLIVDTLLNWTVVDIIPNVRYKINNKNVGGQNSDNTTPTDTADIKWLMQTYRDKAEFYANRLSTYLLYNYKQYPEYTAIKNIADMVPKTNPYFSGLQLESQFRRLERNEGDARGNWNLQY